jgi:hypothetical protein
MLQWSQTGVLCAPFSYPRKNATHKSNGCEELENDNHEREENVSQLIAHA